MSTLELLPEAPDEAAAAVAYYEQREQGLGARLRKEIETASASIVEHPLLWRERPGGYRRVNLAGFPFYIAYFARGNRVIIAAIAHASRHPDYWKSRIPKITS
jgi:plasmid stabilization system protein ParE